MPKIVQATAPLNPVPGLDWYHTGHGIEYFYDGTRNKWLSKETAWVGWGYYGAMTVDRYGRGPANVYSNWATLVGARDATIIAITAATTMGGGNENWTARIYADAVLMASLAVVAAEEAYEVDTDADINASDRLVCLFDHTGDDFNYPVVWTAIKWRTS